MDLKNTNYIIIMESAWNENSIEQIIGRGVRYKSHESLSKSKRNVTVYKLYSIKHNKSNKNIDIIIYITNLEHLYRSSTQLSY